MRNVKAAKALLLAASTAGFGLGLASQANAASYTWGGTGGTQTWDTSGNWTTPGFPNAVGDVANTNVPLASALTLKSTQNITVGALTFGDASNLVAETLSLGHNLTFDNGGSGASLTVGSTNNKTNNLNSPIILNDNLTVTTGSGRLAVNPGGGISGNSHTVTVAAGGVGGYLYLNTDNSTALWVVQSGAEMRISGGNDNAVVGGDVNILNGGLMRNLDTHEVSKTSLITLTGTGRWNMAGAADDAGALAGNGPVNGGGPLGLYGATSSASNDYSGTLGVSGLNLNGGVQRLSGATSNGTGAVAVSGGRLELNKSTGVAVDATGLTVSGGEVRFIQSNQIATAAPVTLSGGDFNVNGQSQTVTTPLSLTASSTIDFGAVQPTLNSILAFGDSSGQTFAGVTNIIDWTGTPVVGGGKDQLYVGTTADLSPTQLAAMDFVNPDGLVGTYAATQLASGEVVPVIAAVPEPASLGLLAAGSSLLLLRRRRA